MPKGINTRNVKKEEEEFKREDCNEVEYNDNGPKKRKKKGKKDAEEVQTQLISTEFLPGSMKKLRACIGCKLVLNRQKWIDLGRCPNCPSGGGISDTTENFNNIVGQVYPKLSWVAQYQGMKDFIPGIYALNVNAGELEQQDEYEEY